MCLEPQRQAEQRTAWDLIIGKRQHQETETLSDLNFTAYNLRNLQTIFQDDAILLSDDKPLLLQFSSSSSLAFNSTATTTQTHHPPRPVSIPAVAHCMKHNLLCWSTRNRLPHGRQLGYLFREVKKNSIVTNPSSLTFLSGGLQKMDCWAPRLNVDDEFEKLATRINPPSVAIDNETNSKATLIKVDSANKRGSLLEVVQVLTDLNLIIQRAYISSDGGWFMDVFHVTEQHGNKLYDDKVADYIQQSLGPKSLSFQSLTRSVDVQAALEHTAIDLTGRERPGLLSEVFAVLADLKCNVVAAEVWTHNSRMASVIYITDDRTAQPINDPDRLAKIKELLLHVLKGYTDTRSANTTVSWGSTHTSRRLHQMMYADCDYDLSVVDCGTVSDQRKPVVHVENCVDKGYTVVDLRCLDRPKLLFDTVFTLTDMQYVVYHATIITEGPEACQEYYIRHMDGSPISSDAERQRVIHCLEAAVRRRTFEGIRLELCSDDRVGLLSDVTRIFRENGISVIRAEVSTRGSQAVNVFYVTGASGNPVTSNTIEAVRKEMGLTVLRMKDDRHLNAPLQEGGRFSLSSLFRSRSGKILYNLGLTNSSS